MEKWKEKMQACFDENVEHLFIDVQSQDNVNIYEKDEQGVINFKSTTSCSKLLALIYEAIQRRDCLSNIEMDGNRLIIDATTFEDTAYFPKRYVIECSQFLMDDKKFKETLTDMISDYKKQFYETDQIIKNKMASIDKKREFRERVEKVIEDFYSNGSISDTDINDKEFMDTLKAYVTENPESIIDIIKNTKCLNPNFPKNKKDTILSKLLLKASNIAIVLSLISCFIPGVVVL